MTSPNERSLWIGTYPAAGAEPGDGEGVWRVDVDTETGAFGAPTLAAEVAAPSFLALHPGADTLYAVSETDPGSLNALRVADGGTLVPLGTCASGGDSPCHVAATGEAVWVANYGDGVATAVPVAADGTPRAADLVLHHGSGIGPVVDRQEGPHAHQLTVLGDHVLVTDLGADVVRRYPARVAPSDGGDVAAWLPAGTGPRHLVALAGGALLVVGELDARLHVLVPAGGGWEHAGSVPVSPGVVAGQVLLGHVTLSADGTRLHVGVRGPDLLAVLRVTDGAVPEITHLADISLGDGGRPRHHEVVATSDGGELLVVALQGASELVSVRVATSGAGELVARAGWATPPACVLVAR